MARKPAYPIKGDDTTEDPEVAAALAAQAAEEEAAALETELNAAAEEVKNSGDQDEEPSEPPPGTRRYECLYTVSHQGKHYHKGATLHLTDKQAKPLILGRAAKLAKAK